jgi:predicted nucleotidyltransferase
MDSPLARALEVIIQVADPDRIVLFGSRAYGEHKEGESNYDLLVLKSGVKRKRKLSQEIYLNFKNIGAPVDAIVEDLDKYEELKANPYMIYSEAGKNGKVVYEKPEIVYSVQDLSLR